jgi:hypothetical protein
MKRSLFKAFATQDLHLMFTRLGRRARQKAVSAGMLACAFLSLETARGQTTNKIIVPNESADHYAPGIGTQIFGFFQSTYANTEFASLGGNPILINSVSLRAEPQGGSLDAVVPSMSISMGTFTRSLSQINGNPALNRGPDFQVVYEGSNVPLHFQSSANPDNFTVQFLLDTPFLYNPNEGHLTVEWNITDFGTHNERVDGVSYPFDTGPVRTVTGFPGDLPYSTGFTMELGYTIVPEPSILAIVFFVGTGLTLVNRVRLT